jgi:hypothetical protein
VLTYLMENEMSFVHHVVKWHGYGYTFENNENLNENIWKHPWRWNPSLC